MYPNIYIYIYIQHVNHEQQTRPIRTRTETCLRALRTAQPKGITAKPSGILKTSDPERPVVHTAQPKGTTAKPSGKATQPKGNTAKLSGTTEHRARKNRTHSEKQNTTLETSSEQLILDMMTYIISRTPKGNTAKLTGATAKPSGDHLAPGTPATGQPAASSTAVGEPSAQKKRGQLMFLL